MSTQHEEIAKVESSLVSPITSPDGTIVKQRKKPGRKPNPASPALRKAQNRAAQRAFRERKERHLRDLEETIKSLRESQYQNACRFQKEIQQMRSLIESLEADNHYLKEVAYSFECSLNSINGNSEATEKIKSSVAANMPRPMETAQQPQFHTTTTSSEITSYSPHDTNNLYALLQQQAELQQQHLQQQHMDMHPLSAGSISDYDEDDNTPTPPDSISGSPPQSFSSPLPYPSADDFSLDLKPVLDDCVTDFNNQPLYRSALTALSPSLSTSGSSPVASPETSPIATSNTLTPYVGQQQQQPATSADPPTLYPEIYMNNAADLFSRPDFAAASIPRNIQAQVTLDTSGIATPFSKVTLQMFQLAIMVSSPDGRPLKPITRFPLTETQLRMLQLPHDPRIDFIPCLHMRARMIECRDSYDLDEVCDLLVRRAKCHGDPRDTDSWELPEEFFSRFKCLVFGYCKVKSRLYRTHGRIPEGYLPKPPPLPASSIYSVS